MSASHYSRTLRDDRAAQPPRGRAAAASGTAGRRGGTEHPPVVLLFGTSARAMSAYVRRLPLDVTPLATTSVALAGVVAQFADCAIVADGAGDTASAVAGGVRELRSANPQLAMVCATIRPARVSHLQLVGLIDEVLAFDAPVLALRVAMEGARTAALLRSTAHAVSTAGHFRPALRNTLVEMLARTPPLRSIRELSRDAAVSRRTLAHQWRGTIGDAVPLRLHDVVAWVLVLRASMVRTRGCTWADAAAEVGVHRHTLVRAARQRGLVMAPDLWADVESGVHAALRRGFEDNVVRYLLGRQQKILKQD